MNDFYPHSLLTRIPPTHTHTHTHTHTTNAPNPTPFHVSQDWAVALYHDRFRELCSLIVEKLDGEEDVDEIMRTIKEAVSGGLTDAEVSTRRRELVGISGCKLRPSTKQSIELQLLRFVKENRDLLPMYDVPLPDAPDLGAYK